jgi:DNA topoisomerase I
MTKSVIFLESTTKKKTIGTFLGQDYVIFATGGHLTELAKRGYYNLGIELEKFTPTYEIIADKKNLIAFWKNFLQQEKISNIYLATDPDREGEAIAAEIVKILKISPNRHQRLFFYEITARSIKEALTNPLTLNKNLVAAQTSRQVLDRIIGFCLSTALQKKLQALSAGRVQSVVLKLIIERELLIRNYEKKKEYIICALCLVATEKITLKQIKTTGELMVYQEVAAAEEVVKKLGTDFHLLKRREEKKIILPKPPLTTSLLLFEAKSQLGFSIAQTTQLAQKLYEGVRLINSGGQVGLITYPRTDSTRVNREFTNSSYNLISQKWGRDYCNFAPSWKKKESKINVQDAHEAIHPTHLAYHPENEELKSSLATDEYQLYCLIFRHSLVSLMAPAQIQKITYTFTNNGYYFATNERVGLFLGFLACAPEIYLAQYRVKLHPKLANISHLLAEKIEIQEYLENKPTRYNEGSLVQELEKLGIGRPSTYNTFGRIIQLRKYAELDKKGHFVPTELGFSVNNWLQTNFSSLINEKYTASLEEDLDRISCGENDYYHFIKNFWEEFIHHFQKVALTS